MIKTFTIWLGDSDALFQSDDRARCVQSQRDLLPGHAVVSRLPWDSTGDPRWDSDDLRIWLLSRGDYDLYVDTDVLVTRPPAEIELYAGLPSAYCGHTCGVPDYWMLAGHPEIFKKMWDAREMRQYWPKSWLCSHRNDVILYYGDAFQHFALTGNS